MLFVVFACLTRTQLTGVIFFACLQAAQFDPPSSHDRKCWCFLLQPLQAATKDNYCFALFFAVAATGNTG